MELRYVAISLLQSDEGFPFKPFAKLLKRLSPCWTMTQRFIECQYQFS